MSENNETSLELVVARLEKLEKANRRLKIAVLVPTILSGMFILMFALGATKKDGGDKSPPYKSESPVLTGDVLRAKRLEIVDDKGTVRAELKALAAGPGLALFDEKGETRAGLALYYGGPELNMYDENGRKRAVLDVANGVPDLVLYDERYMPRAALTVFAGGAHFFFHDEKGRLIWEAPPK